MIFWLNYIRLINQPNVWLCPLSKPRSSYASPSLPSLIRSITSVHLPSGAGEFEKDLIAAAAIGCANRLLMQCQHQGKHYGWVQAELACEFLWPDSVRLELDIKKLYSTRLLSSRFRVTPNLNLFDLKKTRFSLKLSSNRFDIKYKSLVFLLL